jgi:hypothetical protein
MMSVRSYPQFEFEPCLADPLHLLLVNDARALIPDGVGGTACSS